MFCATFNFQTRSRLAGRTIVVSVSAVGRLAYRAVAISLYRTFVLIGLVCNFVVIWLFSLVGSLLRIFLVCCFSSVCFISRFFFDILVDSSFDSRRDFRFLVFVVVNAVANLRM